MKAAPPLAMWARYRALLRRRPFLLLWGAGGVSSLGDHFFSIALMWFAFAATGSSLEVAAIAVVSQVTYVGVGPAAGVWADRWDRRRTLILCDLIRAAVLGVFVLTTWREGFSFPLALGTTLVVEATGRFFGPSRTAYLTMLVEPESLVTANGLMSGTTQAAGLGGQAAAGVAITVLGAVAGFLIDALSFALSALSLAFIRTDPPPGPPGPPAREASPARPKPRHRFWRELADGYRLLVGIPVLRALLLFGVVFNAFFAMIEPAMPAYVHTTLHAGAWAYGLVGALQFAGGLLGGLVAGGVAARFRAGPMLAIGAAAAGLFVAACGVLAFLPLALVLWAAWGFSLSMVGVVEQSLHQALIPRASLARVLALMSSVGMVAMPIGSLMGGWLANQMGAGPLYVVIGAGCLATALAMLAHPTIRAASLSPRPSPPAAG